MSRPAIQQWAAHYIRNMGLTVVPLPRGEKKCLITGWQTRTFDIDHFTEDANVGLRSVNGLVVLDDDFPTGAVACMDDWLPPTGATYGRGSLRRRKRLYRCLDLTKTVLFSDINGGHLLQLRVGQQDMAPPSIHPTGETLTWDGLLVEPSTVERQQLIDGARFAWTSRLLAKYWPTGGRHDLRLAYARVLLETLDIPDAIAVRVLEWACHLGGSDAAGIADVRGVVESTRDRLTHNEHAVGAATVARLLPDVGGKIIRLLREAYGKTDAVWVAVTQLNERFAIISVSNRVVVMETWPDGGIKELWPFKEFRNLLIKESVIVGEKSRPLADVWLQHREGRRYDRLVYVMPGSTDQCRPDDYNGWLGYMVEPVAGVWSKNRDHVFKIICAGNTDYYNWVFNWCAALVQWPGRHAYTALVLRGGEGTGKGHFAHLMLGALFHRQQYLHIVGAEALTGRFNEHLSGKVLVFADESTWGGDPRAADKLKGMVTESTVNIERKFLPLVEEPSALHIIMASNNQWPVAIPIDDRRYMVLDVSDAQRQKDAHFAPLRDELANGGLSAFLHDLLNHVVDEAALRHPISTPGKRDVTALSLKPIQHWWLERLTSGYFTDCDDGAHARTDKWPTTILKAQLNSDYLMFLDRYHRDSRTRRATETELGTFLKPYAKSYRAMVNGKREMFCELRPLAECRAIWVKACGWTEDYKWDQDVVG
jgi:hypothetical protein